MKNKLIDIPHNPITFESRDFIGLLPSKVKEKTWKEHWQTIQNCLKERESHPEYREPKP